MAKFGYDHLHFRSEDPHAAKEFWENMFAAKVIQERELGGAPSFNMDLNGMSFIVSGRAEGEDPERTSSDPRYGLDHFGLSVDNMDEAQKDLSSKGAEWICEPWQIRPGVKIAFIKGPDNISIELAQRD